MNEKRVAPIVFPLLPETYEQLDVLARKYSMPFTAIIEMLIADRASISDDSKNKARMLKAKSKYILAHKDEIKDVFDPSIPRAFIAGYRQGWIDFQTRHKDNVSVIEIEE